MHVPVSDCPQHHVGVETGREDRGCVYSPQFLKGRTGSRVLEVIACLHYALQQWEHFLLLELLEVNIAEDAAHTLL